MHEIAIYINEKPDLDEDKTVWFTNRFYRPNVPLIRLPHNYSSVLIRSLVYDGILDKKWFINYISLVRDFDEINLDIVASIAPYPYYDIIEYISGYFFGTTRGSCYPVIDLIPSTSVIPVLATILMERSEEFNNVVIDYADLFSREEFLLLKEVCDDFDINLYPLCNFSENGAFEFEIILKQKPKINKITFYLNDSGLEFYYQPPLYLEFGLKEPNSTCNATDCAGSHRPMNVVGSYAVYHEYKRDYNLNSGKNYKVGKLFHIYKRF